VDPRDEGLARLATLNPVPNAAHPAIVSAPPAHGLDFLAGGGEMGALMRALDWSRSPLGAPETWSQTLRMMVRLVLSNRMQMFLWWGPRFINLYNDASWPALGGKHPRSMGQPAADCWPEIWHIIGPLIETPFRGGPATWMDDILLHMSRKGFMEETHWTIAYSPVLDDDAPGGIGGVIGTVNEITEKIVGERRVMLLRDLGARASEAKSAGEACAIAAETIVHHAEDVPFALLYLVDDDRAGAHLCGTAGLEAGLRASPLHVSFAPGAETAAPWPLAEAFRSEAPCEVADLRPRLGTVPRGPWPDPPRMAAVCPIRSNMAHQLAGLLVLGVSSHLEFDDAYRGFFDLLGSQVATAIANARAYEEERKRAEALAEIDRAKTAFFSNVSHEFRTPLTLMLGPLEDILARTPRGAHREQLDLVYRNGRRMQKLVNTLLDFSRIEAGRIQASYEPVDLAALTAELASLFRSTIERAGLRLEVDCAPLGEAVYVDRGMWEKIVLNLLSNAFKFTFEGRIGVRLRRTERHVELEVTDTGIGIEEHELARVFERFHRIEDARGRTFEGSGIGLALVSELARLHGGSVSADSVFGAGSRFVVSIPLGRAHLPHDHVRDAQAARLASAGASAFVEEALRWLPDESETPARERRHPLVRAARGEDASGASEPVATPASTRVLLADDNADMRQYVRRLLSGRYVVETVADGEAALAAARENPPDVVLTDIMMPRLDGFGLLQALRADVRTRGIPVIMLSARAGEEAKVEGLEAGATDYLVKPFAAAELLARVRHQVIMKRTRDAMQGALDSRNEDILQLTEALVASRQDLQRSLDSRSESERRWRSLFENSAVGVCLADADGNLVETNPALQKMLGYSAQEMRGLAMDTLTLEEDRADVRARIAGISSGHVPRYSVERRFLRKDGTIMWGHASVSVIPCTEHAPIMLSAVVKDITSHKVAEAEAAALGEDLAYEFAAATRLHQLSTRLLEQTELQPLLEEVLDASIALLDAQFGCVQLLDPSNTLRIAAQRGLPSAYAKHFGTVRENEEASGTALARAERVVVEDVLTDPIFAPHRAIAATAGFRAVQSTPLFDSRARVLGMVTTHFTEPHRPSERDLRFLDLYTREAAKFLERRRAEAMLRDSEERFRRYFELGLIGMATTSPTKGCLEVNDEICGILGYSREELLRMNWAEMTYPDDLAADAAQVERVMSGEIDGYTLDKRWIRKDGRVIDSIMAARCQRRPDGSVEYFVGLVLDTTERKRVAEALRKARAELAHMARVMTMGELAATIAHEINQPLAALVVNSKACQRWLAHSPPEMDEARAALARIAGDANRASAVIAGVRQLVKKDDTRRDVVASVEEVIHEVVALVKPEAQARGVAIQVRCAPGLPGVVADRVQLQQVLLNLVMNAMDAMGAVKERSLEVCAERAEDGFVVTAVRDSGMGIDPRSRERIFDAFYTTKEDGMGMGLAICRSIVEAHGGRIWAERKEIGETFRFTLPAHET
jgi:PAS domain S-box-containing protein